MADSGPHFERNHREFAGATILEPLPNALFRVRTDAGDELTVHLAGAMRVQQARLVPGDRVLIEPSPLDPTKGRIRARTDTRAID